MANAKANRARTVCVHITQDDHGYWMMTLERDDGKLALLSYGGEGPEHDVEHAYRPEQIGLPADAEFRISQPIVARRTGDAGSTKPEPRRAREPYYVIKNGKRVG